MVTPASKQDNLGFVPTVVFQATNRNRDQIRLGIITTKYPLSAVTQYSTSLPSMATSLLSKYAMEA